MKTTLLAGALAILVAAGPASAPASAQVMWDAPMLLAPGSPGGLGIFLLEPPGDGFGVVGTWRASSAPGVGFRAGLAEDAGEELAVLAGLDLSGTLLAPTEELPVGFIWLLGAGVSIGDEVLAAFPAGISAGIDLTSDGILFRPYVTPRVDLTVFSGPGDDLDMSFSVDVGLDLAFTQSWMIRFAASLGDAEALAIGLQFPGVGFE